MTYKKRVFFLLYVFFAVQITVQSESEIVFLRSNLEIALTGAEVAK